MARVLIIDDDPLFSKLAKHRLEADGHEVAWHDGAFGALTAVRHGNFAIILLDVKMPGIEGTRLVSVLRERADPEVRIVLMSATPEPELKQMALDCQADGYFPKKDNLHRLANIISSSFAGGISGTRRALNVNETTPERARMK